MVRYSLIPGILFWSPLCCLGFTKGEHKGITAPQNMIIYMFWIFVNDILVQLEIKPHGQIQFGTRKFILESVVLFGLHRR